MNVLHFLKRLFGTSDGPFKENIKFEMDYSDTIVRFTVPPHSQIGGIYETDTMNYNIYDPRHYFSTIKNQKKIYNDDIDVPCFPSLSTGWSLQESGFLKYNELASIDFRPIIYHIDRLGSLFNKQVMEQAIEAKLTNRYGPANEDRPYKQYYECPVNWKVEKHNSHEWLSFETHRLRNERLYIYHRALPLTNEHFLIMCFLIERNNTPEVIARVNSLIDKIMSTCEVQYSDESLRRKHAAEAADPDMAYSKKKPPLDWSEAYANPPEDRLVK